MTTRKKVVSVARKTTVEDKLNSLRWTEFVKASTVPYDQLSEGWYDFFSAQSDPKTAHTELERLVDIAIQKDIESNAAQGCLK